MKCQKCPKAATLHITEVLPEERFEELHLCEECAQKYLYEPQPESKAKAKAKAAAIDEDEPAALNQRQCPVCGLKFVEFRNTGRLGCPHDYAEFQDELTPLLESIHGETKHCGKTPRRMPGHREAQAELLELRKQLHQAVTAEAYEEAARLRDRIRLLEGH